MAHPLPTPGAQVSPSLDLWEDPQEEQERISRERQADAERKRELEDMRELLADPRGNRFIRRLIARAGLFRTSFNPENDRIEAFSEGERAFGLWLYRELLEADEDNAPDLLRVAKRTKKTT